MAPDTREPVRQPQQGVTALEALQDAHPRITRALEAMMDGELGFAEHLLDDLGGDLWGVIERLELERAAREGPR